MITEFDLPCTACGQDLTEETITASHSESITVAACTNCGTRHYPEAALDRV